MKNSKSIFWIKYNGITIPATKNFIQGEKFHDEQLSIDDNIELRSWNPFHSSLSSAIMCGLEILPVTKNSNILYYGIKTGITLSHISDIVDIDGNITCVTQGVSLNHSNLKNRQNIIFKNNFKEINDLKNNSFDTIFINTFESINLESIIELSKRHLKSDGFVIVLISKNDDTKLKKLLNDYRDYFQIIQNIDLGMYQNNQSLLIGKKTSSY